MKLFSIIVAIVTLGYMLPWCVAVCRGDKNSLMIFIINIAFGWTFIGWIIALAMAVRN